MKQFYLGILGLCLVSMSASGQQVLDAKGLEKMKQTVARLQADIQSKTDSLQHMRALVQSTENKLLLAGLKNSKGKTTVPAIVSLQGNLRAEKNPLSKVLTAVQKGDSILLLDYIDDYWLVQKGEHVGYLNELFVKDTPASEAYKAEIVGYSEPTPATTTYSTPSSTSGRTIHTGPRGGKYYINSKGNKTYIKRK